MQSIQKHNSVNCYESGLSLRDCFKSPGTVSDAFSGVNLRLSFWRKESIGPPTCDGSLGCLLPLLLLTVTENKNENKIYPRSFHWGRGIKYYGAL